MSRKYGLVLLLLTLSVPYFAPETDALPSSRRLFQSKYGYKVSCNLCHKDGGGSSVNNFGQAYLRSGMNLTAYTKIEKQDSDGDGVLNIDEIKLQSNPGDSKSTPKNKGDWLSDSNLVAVPTKELKELFGTADQYAAVEGSLTADQIEKVTTSVGTPLSDDDKVPTFYFAIQGGKRIGVAQFVYAKGRKNPIMVAVAMNTKGMITQVKILKSKEDDRIKSSNFLHQFVGKGLSSPLTVGKDIKAVVGLEEVSQEVAHAVKRALYIIHVVFAK